LHENLPDVFFASSQRKKEHGGVNEKKGSVEFLFHGYEIFRCWYEGRRGHEPVPNAAPALSDDDITPAREVSHRGSHNGWSETPSGRLACN